MGLGPCGRRGADSSSHGGCTACCMRVGRGLLATGHPVRIHQNGSPSEVSCTRFGGLVFEELQVSGCYALLRKPDPGVHITIGFTDPVRLWPSSGAEGHSGVFLAMVGLLAHMVVNAMIPAPDSPKVHVQPPQW